MLLSFLYNEEKKTVQFSNTRYVRNADKPSSKRSTHEFQHCTTFRRRFACVCVRDIGREEQRPIIINTGNRSARRTTNKTREGVWHRFDVQQRQSEEKRKNGDHQMGNNWHRQHVARFRRGRGRVAADRAPSRRRVVQKRHEVSGIRRAFPNPRGVRFLFVDGERRGSG